jgi:ATP-dependent Lon protease
VSLETLARVPNLPRITHSGDNIEMNAKDEDQIPEGGNEPGPATLPEDVLLIVPVRNVVMFPGAVSQVALGRDMSMRAAQEAVQHGHKIGIVLQKDPSVDEPGPEDLHKVGTTVTVVRYIKAPNGVHHLICQGEQRFRVVDYLTGLPFFAARFDLIADQAANDAAVEARAAFLKQKAVEAIDLLPQVPPELAPALQNIDNPGALADMVAGLIDIKPAEKQQILETLKVRERLDRVIEFLTHRVEVLKLSREIGEQTQGKIDERQREYILREQLKTIKKELGEDETQDDLEELRKAIADAKMPEEVEKQATKELRRLEGMPEASTEHSMVRTYLDWLVALPWSKLDAESIDIAKAREILDADHFGLDKVKRRILEYLAVRKLNAAGRSPILCFVGPPGVGKTSLGQSIARALGLKFVRSSLGGVHDEAEIRGHRRTYIGSLPGNIVQSMRKAGTRNPVFMLDEMDKLGVGFHGDPSAALLEVLDPEQNSTFSDHYLDVPFDLSKVLFIGTANVLENIPGPLRDRMEIIELPGYTQDEKLAIATRYLVQRQLKANGLTGSQVSLSDGAIAAVIDGYTREAGVRNLERHIGALLRHAAMKIAEGTAENVSIDTDDVPTILGARRFENEVKLRTSVPGVATGLAWTPVGGDILFIEATLVPGGKGKLILTGQLGEVMKESAQAAVSLAKMRMENLGVDPAVLEKNDLHIHIPAGAIPKDGPSAGVAMFLAVASLLSGRTVRADVAMTGEISLRGLVLPIGGVKEKTLAALRAGIDTVMLPARNKKDLEEIPEPARKQLNFVWLDDIDDALNAALEAPAGSATSHGSDEPRRKSGDGKPRSPRLTAH